MDVTAIDFVFVSVMFRLNFGFFRQCVIFVFIFVFIMSNELYLSLSIDIFNIQKNTMLLTCKLDKFTKTDKKQQQQQTIQHMLYG